jgi:POT family proton-dependent oligopeptide transporter
LSIRIDEKHSYPPGFWLLFLTEMLERYSYFGGRALLVLYLISPAGLGLSEVEAVAVYGLFTASTYLAGLPGGYLGDRWLGGRRAVVLGALAIMIGNALLALPFGRTPFCAGLWVIVCGIGLMKPNISAMVAALFRGREDELDGAFTLYYMGVCIGAAMAGLVTPIVASALGWRWGFAAAGAGVGIGLPAFLLARRTLGEVGSAPRERQSSYSRGVILVVISCLILAAAVLLSGLVPINIVALADGATWAVAALGAGFFGWAIGFAGLGPAERRRIVACLILCTACATYWSGADLAGSSFTLFADLYTDRSLGGMTVPAGVFQSVNPVLIVLLAPVATFAWNALARRGSLPGAAAKFAGGLLFAALAMLVMVGAAAVVREGTKVGPGWLLTTYFLLTIGEILLSPVGLAAINRLAPAPLAGRLMGVWFLAVALGTLAASRLAGYFPTSDPTAMGRGYGVIAIVLCLGGLLLLTLSGRIASLSTERNSGTAT